MKARDLIPLLVLAIVALVGWWLESPDPAPCPAGPDGPQFYCWLIEHQNPTIAP